MVGWHHCLNGHEFEQTPGDSEGQGSLACYSPWGHKELDMTEQQEKKKTKLPAFPQHQISWCLYGRNLAPSMGWLLC